MRPILVLATAFAIAACGAGSAPPDTGTGGPVDNTSGTVGSGASRIDSPWPVKTRLHIDLWLHGWAMIQSDTNKVPYFRRGYAQAQRTARSQARVSSGLDANRDRLQARLALNPDLVNSQFLPLYFESWDQMSQAIQIFLNAGGDPNRATTAMEQQAILMFAQSFPTGGDRDWLRMFSQALTEENNNWYRQYWTQQQRERAPVIERIDSLWNKQWRPKLQGYLNNTQQASGDMILSLPLNGEGRSVSGGKERSVATIGFPERQSDAIEAIYVFVHEVASAVANQAVSDNTTPAEKRGGAYERLSSAGLVRGGELVLAKVAPELLDGYARYYLRAANVTPSGDVRAQLAREFSLPPQILSAIQRQVDIVVGGI